MFFENPSNPQPFYLNQSSSFTVSPTGGEPPPSMPLAHYNPALSVPPHSTRRLRRAFTSPPPPPPPAPAPALAFHPSTPALPKVFGGEEEERRDEGPTEEDELAAVLALSQAESLRQEKMMENLSTQEEEDFARALQESLNLNSYSSTFGTYNAQAGPSTSVRDASASPSDHDVAFPGVQSGDYMDDEAFARMLAAQEEEKALRKPSLDPIANFMNGAVTDDEEPDSAASTLKTELLGRPKSITYPDLPPQFSQQFRAPNDPSLSETPSFLDTASTSGWVSLGETADAHGSPPGPISMPVPVPASPPAGVVPLPRYSDDVSSPPFMAINPLTPSRPPEGNYIPTDEPSSLTRSSSSSTSAASSNTSSDSQPTSAPESPTVGTVEANSPNSHRDNWGVPSPPVLQNVAETPSAININQFVPPSLLMGVCQYLDLESSSPN